MSLGKVTSHSITYELTSKREWRVTLVSGERIETAEQLLALQNDDSHWWGPAMGQPGAAVLADLAAQVGGQLELPTRPLPREELEY